MHLTQHKRKVTILVLMVTWLLYLHFQHQLSTNTQPDVKKNDELQGSRFPSISIRTLLRYWDNRLELPTTTNYKDKKASNITDSIESNGADDSDGNINANISMLKEEKDLGTRDTKVPDQNNVQAANGSDSKLMKPDINLASLSKLIPKVYVKEVDCAKIVNGDTLELEIAHIYHETHNKTSRELKEYLNMTQDCLKFKRERQYVIEPLSVEEADFPIAFSIIMHKDLEQTERLLRAIYRPQNQYCLHVDKKSPRAMHEAVQGIAGCFDNVFVASPAIDVQWGLFSTLEPDLLCMEELFKRSTKWRYFINLTGQEFPLKTNLGLVRILKAYNGANNLGGSVKSRNKIRTKWVFNGISRTTQLKPPPPKGIRLTKGSAHITASRGFVDFILHNGTALKFRDWVKATGIPDETFFSSLNHSPELRPPGAYTGEPETHPTKYPFMTRFKNWGDMPCTGVHVRGLCIFGIGDIGALSKRQELFVNKFFLDYQPLTLDCMEELHYNRTRDELHGKESFNVSFYESLDFVKNHI